MPQLSRIGIVVDQMLPVPICSQALENVKTERLSEQALFIVDAIPQGPLERGQCFHFRSPQCCWQLSSSLQIVTEMVKYHYRPRWKIAITKETICVSNCAEIKKRMQLHINYVMSK